MIGLDTNVIARIVLADDAVQTRQALAVLARAQAAGETVVLSLATVLELEWVLRGVAKIAKSRVLLVFKQLLETEDLQIQDEQILEQAIYTYESNKSDFAECLFWAQYQRMGCRAMLTFDAVAARMGGVDLVGSP